MELDHQRTRRLIVDAPQRYDHRARTRCEQSACEAKHFLAMGELPGAAIARAEHDQIRGELEAHEIRHRELITVGEQDGRQPRRTLVDQPVGRQVHDPEPGQRRGGGARAR